MFESVDSRRLKVEREKNRTRWDLQAGQVGAQQCCARTCGEMWRGRECGGLGNRQKDPPLKTKGGAPAGQAGARQCCTPAYDGMWRGRECSELGKPARIVLNG
jgi:hypothetical protein